MKPYPSRWLGLFLIAMAVAGTARTAAAQKPDTLPGVAVWRWEMYDLNGKKIAQGNVQGTADGKLTQIKDADDVRGSWKATEKGRVQVEFVKVPKLSGELSPTRTPGVYEGTCAHAEHGKVIFRVRLFKD